MASGRATPLVVRTFLFIISLVPLVYIGRKIFRKQRRPSDCGSREKEGVETKLMEDETKTSTAAREQGSFNYKVFISFRGKDTRNGFTSHLHKELKKRGIATFIDSDDLKRGKKIQDLITHIEGSMIFLPIFSKNYADSKWCLREITKMVEINKREGAKRPIIPVFYDVDPSDVKDPTASFGKALEKHQRDKKLSKEQINEWRAALIEAGNTSGFCLCDAKGNEAKLITLIGNDVSNILWKVPFDIQPIGIGPCLHTLQQMLERETDDICMIGICGLGGIGKTTLAMALYNELSHAFGDSCFLPDIRETEKREGLHFLQCKLMNEVLGENMAIGKLEEGVSLIRQRFGSKKVLLILDDVDHTRQLKAFTAKLGEEERWFGVGSKVIVTTRDEKVLTNHGLQKEDIYFLEGLDVEHSLQLFCRHAFRRDQPLAALHELSQQVVHVAQGLPLALIVFGSLFCDLKEKQEWEEMLEKLESDQDKDVHERLKISYDSLDHSEKSVFLDIACFFIGKKKDYPVYMWKACGYVPTITLKVLQNKSLVEIDEYDRFQMHDQIRDMGRMIVKEEGNSDPLKYSRPWNKDQMLKVLRDAKVSLGNPYVLGVDFAMIETDERELHMRWKVLEAMPSLRMITGAYWNWSFEDQEEIIRLPGNIQWISWKSCPYETLVFHNSRHEQLCVLDLESGCFQDFGSRSLVFPNLKVLDLASCKNLIWTPDFTHLPSLEVLRFDRCESLAVMGESIGHLKKLVTLSMRECWTLEGLPAGLCKLTSLEYLNIYLCIGISCLPEQIGDLRSLKYLSLSYTLIPSLPDSIGEVQLLEELDLRGCKRLSVLPKQIGDLKSLKCLDLYGTSISNIPDSIGRLQYLEKLDLGDCSSLRNMPDSIGGLRSLSWLSLERCKLLEQLPNYLGTLTSLRELNISKCESLTEVPDSLGDLHNDLQISLEGCISLEKMPNSKRLLISTMIHHDSIKLEGLKSLRRLPESLGNVNGMHTLCLYGCESLEELPESIGRLESLKELHISGCTLLRRIPESIGNLKSLKRLSLKQCQSLEELPESIGRLESLKELHISGCTLLRRIPESIGNLKSLKRLSLKQCQSLEELPESIEGLESLEDLDIHESTSLRRISKSIGNLKNLRRFSLKHCQSLEELPVSLGGLESLEDLDLQASTLLRMIPQSIGNLKSLKHLSLEHCQSLKELPESIEGLESLEDLDLDGSTSLRRIPESIGNLKSLKHLSLKNCRSLEELQVSHGGLESLEDLDLDCGTSLRKIEMGNLKSLKRLSLKQCGSLEALPESTCRLESLEILDLSDCSSLRRIPESIENLKSLELLSLKHCQALEELPESIGALESLRDLDLHGSSLLRRMPKSVGNLKSLERLSLKDCRSLEELPECIGDLESLTALHICVGMTIKKVPDFIGKLKNLHALHLKENIEEISGFVGGLPQLNLICVKDCQKLEFLPQLPSSLTCLEVQGCSALRKLPTANINNLRRLSVDGCKALSDLSGLGSLSLLKKLRLTGCDALGRDGMDMLSQASFYHLNDILISGASDGSHFLFGVPRFSNDGDDVWMLFCLTEEAPSNTSNINIHFQVEVEGKMVHQGRWEAQKYEGNYVSKELGQWAAESKLLYGVESGIFGYVKEGHVKLRVRTTYDDYQLEMAYFFVTYSDY